MIDIKYLPRRTYSDKVLHEKPFNIDKNPKYYEYQHGTWLAVLPIFDVKSTSRTEKSASIGGIKK